MQNVHSGFGPQNNNTGSGRQYNNNGPGWQNINYGGDQHFGVEIDSRKALWDRIGHVGFSHNAEQQCSRGECSKGTREEVLRIIHGWRVRDGWESPICWLAGAAGVGKTSIAMTVAKSCETNGLLESFFFFRSDPDRNHPSVLMLAIAHGLAVTNDLVREEINNRIKANWSILGARFEEQFKELVLQPIARSCARAADDTFVFQEPSLIIIDGLDECGDEETQLRILSTISSAYQEYPHFPLRFLISSRPEAWIREAFSNEPLCETTEVIILDKKFNPTRDIRRYYTHQFQDIRSSSRYRDVPFPDPWPSERDLHGLVWRSDGQFAHASTTVRFIKLPFSNPLKQLRLILDNNPIPRPSKSPFQTLDSLYHIILSSHPDRNQMLPILAAIVVIPRGVAIKPSPLFIELLLGLDPGDVSLTLRALHSVLDIRGRNDGITVFHTSFTDYLFDQRRSGDFYIDASAQHDFLAQQWLSGLSSSRIRGYNFSHVDKSHFHAFLSRWHDFCGSLRGTPTPQLLESLRNLDHSALFFSSLRSMLEKPWGVTVTEAGHSNEFSVSKDDHVWREKGYEWVETWLKTDDDPVDRNIIKRFRDHPKCFLFRVSGKFNCGDIHQIFSIIREPEYKLEYKAAECEVSLRESYDPIHIMECYCHRSGTCSEPTPTHPLRGLYQGACLQTVRNLVSDLLSIDLSWRWSSNNEELYRIFAEMLDNSLLQHCAFEPELFDLCTTFFSYARGCASFYTTAGVAYSVSTRNSLKEWLETCPKPYAREAKALKYQLDLFFALKTKRDSD